MFLSWFNYFRLYKYSETLYHSDGSALIITIDNYWQFTSLSELQMNAHFSNLTTISTIDVLFSISDLFYKKLHSKMAKNSLQLQNLRVQNMFHIHLNKRTWFHAFEHELTNHVSTVKTVLTRACGTHTLELTAHTHRTGRTTADHATM